MPRHLTIDDLGSIAVPEAPALSPDGRTIAYAVRTIDLNQDRELRRLWTVGVDGSAPTPLTDGVGDSAPAWSPDGAVIAFLRTEDDEPPQIWLTTMDGAPRRLTTLPDGAGTPVWRPDGSAIAFVAAVDRAAPGGADQTAEARARRAHAPIVADRLDYLRDGTGYLGTIRRHLHLLTLATGACTQLTDGDWDAGSPAWSPDGARLAFPAAIDDDADLSRRSTAQVLAPGETPTTVGKTDGTVGALSWSADGEALLVAGTPGAPDTHYALFRVAVADGATTDLSSPLDRNVMFGAPGYPGATPRATPGDASVLFCARDRGCTHLYSVPEDGGTPQRRVGEAGSNVSGISPAGDQAAFILTSPTSFGEVATLELSTGATTVHTSHGETLLAQARPFPRVAREFTISDGVTVEGWLMRDPHATGPQPLLLDIHGGPHNAWNSAADEVHLYHQALVAQGWTILLLNSRGSDGYGEEFYTSLLGAWGLADKQDFLEPLDQLVAEGIADPARLAVTGYSYGGYMTCFLTAHDDRFAAAVTGGPVADISSQVGTSDNRNGLAVGSFRGYPWSDAEHYAAMNPYAHIGEVTTPTLVLQGGEDYRCPVGQARQWHTALRQRGVPARIVIYPGGSHVFVINGRPSHRLDYNRRLLDWVTQHAG